MVPLQDSMPTPIIIDTDPGVDDVLAILYALASPEVHILAFVVSFGNTDIDSAYQNIFKLYHTLSLHFQAHPEDKSRFPNFFSTPFIAKGPSRPLKGSLHDAQYFHGRDGLGDISQRHPHFPNHLSHPQLRVSDKPAHILALDLIKSLPPNTITYVSLGPLTNLALIARQDPLTSAQLGRVVSMGGAFDVPGNCSPVAEFNFYADPYAVHDLLVVANSIPLSSFLLCPLDLTTPHDLPFPLYKSLVDPAFHSASSNPSIPLHKLPLVHFTSAFLERTREIMLQFGKDALELHDLVAMWCAVQNPPSIPLPSASRWTARSRSFQVERSGDLTRGMLVVDRRDDYYSRSTDTTPYSQVQATLETAIHHHITVLDPTPSQGVPCITATPGNNELIKQLLTRVWGIQF